MEFFLEIFCQNNRFDEFCIRVQIICFFNSFSFFKLRVNLILQMHMER